MAVKIKLINQKPIKNITGMHVVPHQAKRHVAKE